jgi:ribonuclease HI
MTKTISVYSDGSSGGDAKGAIGWGYIVTDWDDIIGVGSGGQATGTNNAAELMGAINGLRFVYEKNLHTGHLVEIVSDSTYTLGLASGDFEAEKNKELAAEIRKYAILTGARTRWIKGHSGDIFNDKADELAKAARDKLNPNPTKKRRLRRREERRKKRAQVKAYLRGELWRPPLVLPRM